MRSAASYRFVLIHLMLSHMFSSSSRQATASTEVLGKIILSKFSTSQTFIFLQTCRKALNSLQDNSSGTHLSITVMEEMSLELLEAADSDTHSVHQNEKQIKTYIHWWGRAVRKSESVRCHGGQGSGLLPGVQVLLNRVQALLEVKLTEWVTQQGLKWWDQMWKYKKTYLVCFKSSLSASFWVFSCLTCIHSPWCPPNPAQKKASHSGPQLQCPFSNPTFTGIWFFFRRLSLWLKDCSSEVRNIS